MAIPAAWIQCPMISPVSSVSECNRSYWHYALGRVAAAIAALGVFATCFFVLPGKAAGSDREVLVLGGLPLDALPAVA